MKKNSILTTLVLCTFILVPLTDQAQQLFNGVNYQAIVRDNGGEPIVNQAVSLEFRVHESSPTGTVVFTDLQNSSTNAHGLVSVVIGKGTSVSGDLTTLDYANQDYFLEVLVDGSSIGTQRLEAVPMSLIATSMELGDLTDVDGTTPSTNQVLKWNGATWSPAADNGGSGSGQWTENTASGIESEFKNVGIGSNAHNNKRLFIECDSIPTGILVINNDGSPGPEVPQGVISLVTVVDKSEGSALVGGVVTGSNIADSLFGVRTLADAQGGQANVFGAHCEAYGIGNGNKYGVFGRASGANSHGIYGTTSDPTGFGVYGRNEAPNGVAGYFDGKLTTNSWFSVDDAFTVRPNVSSSAVKVDLKNASDISTVELFATGTNLGGGKVWVSDASGDTRISLAVNSSGIGRVSTDELEIKGGSDLAEFFKSDAGTLEPGSVVGLDPNGSGAVVICDDAYDKNVIGVVSGANGIHSGMLMGQDGSEASGDTPIAVVGRVYVKANHSNGIIEPGDLLCSSAVPGIAMKATDQSEAWGAVIGKALSGMDENGFVLVLVNLQ